MKYLVEFRVGTYLTADTERSRRGGSREDAMTFDTEAEAEAAEPWFAAGAMVVPTL